MCLLLLPLLCRLSRAEDDDDMDMDGFGFDSEPVDEDNEMDVAFVQGEVSYTGSRKIKCKKLTIFFLSLPCYA